MKLMVMMMICVMSTGLQAGYGYEKRQVPCLFVFGDSLFDNGNNNYLRTSARVNYPPYGIDSPGHFPTGRFSNGLNLIDVIAGHLGFQFPIPPYAWIHKLDRKMLVRGVNYASGSGGIRKETGQHLGDRVPLDNQLLNHKNVISMISKEIGEAESKRYLKKCLYTINMGSNDYLNNYYLPDKYPTSKQYSRKQYTHVLMEQYAKKIMLLHAMGARKVAVFSQGELGCIPQTMNMYKHLGDLCYNEMNEASRLFNHNLRVLVDKLNRKLPDANFTCINIDVISRTAAIGMVEWAKPCCKVRWDGQCQQGITPCKDREHYIFFDNFHPTEAMNIRVGHQAYSASTPEQVHPVDIRTLVRT